LIAIGEAYSVWQWYRGAEKAKARADQVLLATQKVLNEVNEAVTPTPDLAGSIDTSQLPPSIYIHIRDEEQRPKARQLKQQLEEKGIVVPGIEKVDKGPPGTDLRYCGESESDEANEKAT